MNFLNRALFFPAILLHFFVGSSQDTGPVIFDFGTEMSEYGVDCSTILPQDSRGLRYGITGDVIKNSRFCTTTESFTFWATVPEGNYRVKVVLGNENEISNTTIKAESRRLMVYDHNTEGGAVDTVEFIINIRTPKISTGGSISLKDREYPYLNWDSFLTLEFSGSNPCIRNISIEDVDVPTIFLAGNSTVVDQEVDPWASWGQMFPLFLKPVVAVANFAESGESLKSFEAENRLKKVQSQIGTGDYLLSEFAHNDQKSGPNYVEPYTTYQEYLMKFANVATNVGATPVFVTSTNRRSFDGGGIINNTLGDYPDAMRQLAQEEDIFLIDLNAMSKDLFEALGIEGSKKAFVHYAANSLPWGNATLADNTHFNPYGAWQLAKCVVEGIRTSDSPLKEFLRDDIQSFDPGTPDPTEEWKWKINPNESVKHSDTVSMGFKKAQIALPELSKFPQADNSDFVFYPNPSNGKILFNSEMACSLEVLELDGKVVFTKQLIKEISVDVSFLPQGIYMVRLRTDSGIQTGKLIKN